MNFLAPIAAGLSALSIPIILLYMLRLRRTEMRISSNFLWRDLVRDREANAPWQKLKFSWLLILQLLILAALVLALMRPYLEVETIASGRSIILLDASASMNATDVNESRFVQAQSEALNIIETMSGDDEVSLIRVAAVPEVLISLSDNRSELRDAIQNASPGDAPADWGAALTLAAAGAQGAETLNIIIISDGNLPNGLPEVPGEVRFVTVGDSPENIAITALATRPIPGEGPQLFAQVTNFGDQNAEVIFDIELDGELFSAQRYEVDAGSNRNILVDDLPDTFDRLIAGLNTPAASSVPDYLASDDEAFAVHDIRGTGRIAIITERNLFLTQIFSSLPGVRVTQATPTVGIPDGDFDLYVFDGWVPPLMPDGDLFFINPPRNNQFFSVDGRVEDINQARVTRVERDHPLTQYLDFGDVNIRNFQTISDYDEWGQSLIQAEGGDLFVAGQVNDNQIAVLTFALQDSDLPLQLAFPILISNLSQWYTPPRILDVRDTVLPGAALVMRPLEGAQIRVTLPDGDIDTFAIRPEGQTLFANTTQTGIYQIEVLNEASEAIATEFFAVNLFDTLESNIRPQTSLNIGTITVDEALREESGQRELWEYLALLGLGILLVEWIYYHRATLRARLNKLGWWNGQQGRRNRNSASRRMGELQ